MYKIYNKTTKEVLGRLTEEELQFLKDHLEEESLKDNDFYIQKETVETFAAQGAPQRVLDLLTNGMRSDGSLEISFEKDGTATASS